MASTIHRTLILCAAFVSSCSGGGGGSGSSSGSQTIDADLVPVEVTFSPDVASAGSALLTTDSVRNDGTQTAPSFRVGVYLSEDDDLTRTDTLLGFRTVPELAPGAVSSGGGQLTLPPFTPPGSYRLGVIVDSERQVAEPDESNNVLLAPVTLEVEPAVLPDLTLAALDFAPLTIDSGSQLNVADTVANGGVAAATAFQVGIYLSLDANIETSDVLIGFRTIDTLGAGASSSASDALTVPSSLAPGTWYVGAIADDQDAVVENDELNNMRVAGSPLTVTRPPLADLTVTQMDFTPGALEAGSEITVTEAVLNQGDLAAGTFQVGVYLSTDSVLDETDVLLGIRTVSALGVAQESLVIGETLTIPSSTPGGTYFVGALADHTDLIPESDEANNARVGSGVLEVSVPPLPDLRPLEITFSPGAVNPDLGDLLSFSEECLNDGAGDAGPFRVGVYLSPNPVVTPSDLLVSSRLVSSLSIGASTGAASQVPLPPGIGPGSYYVGVYVDDESALTELSEANNVLLASGTLDVTSTPDPMPNLVMTEVSSSSSQAPPGGMFQVVTRVENTGDLSAGAFHVGIYLSVDPVVTTDDTFLGERHLPGGLPVGFASVSSAPVTIPAELAGGTYHLGAFADAYGAVSESDEGDNALAAPGTFEVVVPPPPAPDLIVTELSFTVTVLTPGQEFEVTETVRNAGPLAAAGFRVGVYLSTDAVITIDDVRLGTRTVAALAPEATSGGTYSVFVPGGQPAGDYYIGILADDQDVVPESNEANNTRTSDAALPLF